MTDRTKSGIRSAEHTLPFTGERYTPEISGSIALEHLHRYAVARGLVTNKTVLDIACGEGYGSFMLAEVAQSVIGVDRSIDSIVHACERYKKDNLKFMTGTCAKIPLPGNSVDVVVSFETIEHHDQHDQMMAEIKRILRPGGFLIVSTPDKHEYAAVTQGPNPYHVKELTGDEFAEMLARWFKNIAMYGQRIAYGSYIVPKGGSSTFLNYEWSDGRLETVGSLARTLYYIAVVSDAQLPPLGGSLFERRIAGQDMLDGKVIQTLEIVAFSPRCIELGQPFNVQPNGSSAIWVRTSKDITNGSQIRLGACILKTTLQGDIATALVPSSIVQQVGNIPLVIVGLDGKTRSNTATLKVVQRNKFRNDGGLSAALRVVLPVIRRFFSRVAHA